LVYVGARLIYAAGIGMDCSDQWPCSGERVALRWQSAREPDDVELVE
jgi:hypothetical protein